MLLLRSSSPVLAVAVAIAPFRCKMTIRRRDTTRTCILRKLPLQSSSCELLDCSKPGSGPA
ncbi:hypothetical protein PR003_g27041 [Phytophthora rubi]|uniref:Uncharacterized protein n=1 Tax=Phytophthora rubi TaxID=129364 RepID=A0A6A3IAT8_9STRA|nr:hypothetical protein PR002_g25858 [Phytophthora rubi]KAE8977103.1 hypothetical protein PR001_g25221 [Phytophthora rubi]KAE9283758.1 hypothetical protein PR003_g27041 [Phytophthora rubi]